MLALMIGGQGSSKLEEKFPKWDWLYVKPDGWKCSNVCGKMFPFRF